MPSPTNTAGQKPLGRSGGAGDGIPGTNSPANQADSTPRRNLGTPAATPMPAVGVRFSAPDIADSFDRWPFWQAYSRPDYGDWEFGLLDHLHTSHHIAAQIADRSDLSAMVGGSFHSLNDSDGESQHHGA